MSNLGQLSLINKICQELQLGLGFSDRDMAEMLIDLCTKAKNKNSFLTKVKDIDSDFPDAVAIKIYETYQSSVLKNSTRSKSQTKEPSKKNESLKGLSIPDTDPNRTSSRGKVSIEDIFQSENLDRDWIEAESIKDPDYRKPKKPKVFLTAAERWEQQQLVNSGFLSKSEVIEETNEDEDVEIEVELNKTEPKFLKGHKKFNKSTAKTESFSTFKPATVDEKSLLKVAENQKYLLKERREVRRAKDKLNKSSKLESLNKEPIIAITSSSTSSSRLKSSRRHSSYSSLDKQKQELPIYKLKQKILQAFKDNQILVVIGETGSGKSTQMPQYLHEIGLTRKGIIGCTQPRRVAAISVAKRVADEMNTRIGDYVGYTIRFNDRTSHRTRIKYMTDGMLKREYLLDPQLKKYSVIILDEAHERTIHTDVLFALLKKLTKKRKDLKLIVTSATLDADKFSKYFNDCPIFSIPGRTFPVEIFYSKDLETDYLDAALVTVLQVHLSQPAGDILVFLTGQEEIEMAIEILQSRLKTLGKKVPDLLLLPAYGALPTDMQQKIFEKTPEGKRKCVIATNIAEASLTIDGIYYVIDPGFVKQNVYHARFGMDTLQPVPISQASAKQRAGRAGRTGPGKCYRLYTEKAYNDEMLVSSIPEIQRTNLGPIVLQLKAMGINDLLNFDFLDAPPTEALVSALQKLYGLGALDNEGLLTKLGHKMASFPLEPVLAKTLLTSVYLKCSKETLSVVSMLSIETPFYRPRDKKEQADRKKARFHHSQGDHFTLLRVYENWCASGFSKQWCFDNFVQFRLMQRAHDIRKQLSRILETSGFKIKSCAHKYELVQKSITAGFFMHAVQKDKNQTYTTLYNEQEVYIHPSSTLFNRQPKYLLYHELIMTSKEYMRNVMVIEPKWLLQLAPKFFQKSNPNEINDRKRKFKIEPLFNKFQPKDSWRLSYKMNNK